MKSLLPKKYGLLPSFFWTTEINGMGKAIRVSMRWPRLLPIPFYCDHGIALRGSLQKHEEQNCSDLFVTWNRYRYEALARTSAGKTILHCEHPWITFRRIKKIEKLKEAKGTLLFLPHRTSNGIEIVWDREMWFEKVMSYGIEEPIGIMLHPADLNTSTIEWCDNNKLKWYTAGDNFHRDFIDKFYNITRKFNYAIGALGGSELFYCHEMGVEYRIVDVGAKIINHNKSNDIVGDLAEVDELRSELISKKMDLFSIETLHSDSDRDFFVEGILGLKSTSSLRSLRKRMFSETLKLILRC